MTFSRKHRSEQREIMDNLEFQGKEMQNLLKDLNLINKWLGGNKITIKGLKSLLKNHPKSQEITILDIGCGDGNTLRNCVNYAQQNNFKVKGIGIDFNDYILEEAKFKSASYTNLEYQKIDVFLERDKIPYCDIATCTLFLHHFENDDIEYLLTHLILKTNIGLIVNDLHRSWLAFNLFKIISMSILKTKTAAHDGLVSIAKGFRKKELFQLSQRISNQKSSISWRWAFRYLWILEKESKSL